MCQRFIRWSARDVAYIALITLIVNAGEAIRAHGKIKISKEDSGGGDPLPCPATMAQHQRDCCNSDF